MDHEKIDEGISEIKALILCVEQIHKLDAAFSKEPVGPFIENLCTDLSAAVSTIDEGIEG